MVDELGSATARARSHTQTDTHTDRYRQHSSLACLDQHPDLLQRVLVRLARHLLLVQAVRPHA